MSETRLDPELGPARLCPGCHEFWPLDATFWHLRDGRLDPRWPARCRACCIDYSAARRRMAQSIERQERLAIPAPREGRCNALMHYSGRCGRRANHRLKCRSIAAMAAEAARKFPRPARIAA